ncbi:putative aminopeptidase W07G4.4 [Halyomorpha halys]|uniref:putative aminopeptidase W07G4.4 n=1 Tax=Halyomorpha halys TaxID=286706 RepID=UPI0034D22C26
MLAYELKVVTDINDSRFDCVLLISHNATEDDAVPQELKDIIQGVDTVVVKINNVSLYNIDLPAKRLFYASTGSIKDGNQDVRCFTKAAHRGIRRVVKAKLQSPLIVLGKYSRFIQSQLVSLLGVLEALYAFPIYCGDYIFKRPKVKIVGVLSPASADLPRLITLASALETGRIVARDIGGTGVVFRRIKKYMKIAFPARGNVNVKVISREDILEKEYPVFTSIERAGCAYGSNTGRLIYLTYEGSCITETLLIASVDSAVAAGFMKMVSILKPDNLKVVAVLSLVSTCWDKINIVDEIITSRAGKIISVNTKADRRMVMADVLYHMKEIAKSSTNPHLFTIAHAMRTDGTQYTIATDNGPARMRSFSQQLQKCGNIFGDVFEVGTIRKVDWDLQEEESAGLDIVNLHGVAANLMKASGLHEHGLGSTQCQLPYTHLDIAAPKYSNIGSASSLLGLAVNYLSIDI